MDIRRSHSILAKYPMEEEETKESWEKRVGPEMEADFTRKEGESLQDHLKRIYEPKVDDIYEMAPKILSAICKVFSLRELSEEDMDKLNWLDIKTFVYDVLSVGDIPAEDFYPKRTISV